MKSNVLLLGALVLFLLGACKKDKEAVTTVPQEAVTTTFYLIRHAEKDRSDPNNQDPELSQDGLGRAIGWAEVLDPVSLNAIYTTDYERTAMTAAPTAVKKDISVTYYDPNSLDTEALKRDFEGGNVLIVGHSNTTPMVANKLLGEDRFQQMDDNDNATLFIVKIVNGVATASTLKIDWFDPRTE